MGSLPTSRERLRSKQVLFPPNQLTFRCWMEVVLITHVITFADVHDTNNGWSHSGGHKGARRPGTPLHTDTQGCTAEAQVMQEAGTAPAPVSTVCASPQSSLSFQWGLSLGERGWDEVHQGPPQAMMGASEGTSGRNPAAGAQECPLLDTKGWCSPEREASGQAGGGRGSRV